MQVAERLRALAPIVVHRRSSVQISAFDARDTRALDFAQGRRLPIYGPCLANISTGQPLDSIPLAFLDREEPPVGATRSVSAKAGASLERVLEPPVQRPRHRYLPVRAKFAVALVAASACRAQRVARVPF